ncbi:MAG: acyl-CoA desaturase, partial [Xanthobacteraceae bacterium]
MTTIEGVVSEQDAEPKVPPGVLLKGPLVDAKVREIRLMFAILYGGTAAALIWVVTQGIGWTEIAVFIGMYLLTMFGMGAGMHRLLVHRSFRCGPVMRTFFCMIGTMAMQGSVLRWVSNHRRHHLYADKPG